MVLLAAMAWAADLDGDGVDASLDCDDSDPATYPGAPDDPEDGVVTDCDPAGEGDADGDGAALDDCDDADATVFPGAVEVWYDGVDQDCDGRDDDQDRDGFLLADDCDDTDPTAWPDSYGWTAECAPRAAWEPAAQEEIVVEERGVKGGGGCATAPAPSWLALVALLVRRR